MTAARSVLPQETEAQFQQAVLQLAVALHWKAYHTHDSRRSAAGFPDLILVRGRRLIAAELKTKTGRVTEAQRIWLDALALAGVETHCWRPSDWDEITRVLGAKRA